MSNLDYEKLYNDLKSELSFTKSKQKRIFISMNRYV